MNTFKRIAIWIYILFSTLLPFSVYAASADFVIDTSTEVSYITGNNFVTVTTTYNRTVKNSSYYFPASGEKTFHIPDISDSNEDEVRVEREYKLSSLFIKDDKGSKVNYSVEEGNIGEGIFVSVPNYKTTTPSSAYKIFITYNTHDLITKVGKFVNIIGTSLPTDTVFERKDEENGTITLFNYYFSIVTDSDIQPLSKAFPTFTKEEKDSKSYYYFNQAERIGNSPYLEFGTSALYRFELEYKTAKTDTLIPEKYSDVFKALSTNIYELSLPREFSETNQKVYFENVSPTPSDIYRDAEGNILALFEVPANQESIIKIDGYIMVNQDELKEESPSHDIDYSEYLEKIKGSEYIRRYLSSTKYWEVSDELIQQEATTLKKDQKTLLDIVKANYKFVNDRLEYDQQKATSENERIGAKAALLGGASVCMEYADLMISLLRSQGIPSRAAIGYANLDEQIPEEQVRHQWVQIWVPDYGWLSVDPTFESNNMKIGQMMDRIVWEVFNNDSLSNIRVYSANNIKNLTSEGYTVKIYGVSDDVKLNELRSYADLVSKEEISELSPSIGIFSSTMLKTTTFGKALIITIPILIVLVILIIGISVITHFIKKRRKNSPTV